jgi:Dolichyl-phosphate-mannose-protein mannosyltransferase
VGRCLAIGTAVVLVAGLSVGLNTGFRSPPRFDGAGYSVLALSLMEGRGYHEIDRPDAPPHDHFPPGYPLALATLWSVTGRSILAAHLFSMACTITAVGLAWCWFRRIIEAPFVADALGLTLAVNWTWGAVGGAIQSEPLYLLLSMIVLNVANVRSRFASLGLGILLGLCVLTRHVGIGLLIAVLIDRLCEQRDRRSLRDTAAMAVAALVVIGPWIYWLATVRRNTQVGLLDASGLPALVAGQLLFYARRLPDALTGPFVEVATVFSSSRAVGLAATMLAAVVSTVLLIGLIRCLLDPRRRLAGLVPLATLPLLLVWPFTEAGRFLIPLVPCLLVGMVEGLDWVLRWLLKTTPHPNPPPRGGREPDGKPGEAESPLPLRRRVGWGVAGSDGPRYHVALLVLLASIPYPAYAILTHRAEAQRRTHADFDAACAWIAQNAAQPGPILTRHPSEVFWQSGRLVVFPASDESDALIRQIQEQKVAYVLVDSDRFANAPPTPLARLVTERPALFAPRISAPVAVYEIRRDSGP